MYELNELMHSGHLACAGCGATIAMRYALKALGEQSVLVIPACCWSIINGPFPYTSIKVPLIHTAFETGASTASGVKAGLEARGDTETTVAAWVGDGGTFDIGIQALSGAAERNDDIIYFCYDNEAYMNTGIQRSSATPFGTWTTTTPSNHPKSQPKKNMMEIMAAHRIPYATTCSVAFPEDMMTKIGKARAIRGTKFIHIYSPCPTGWKCPSSLAVKIARLAVHTKIFPLYEVENGDRYNINIAPKNVPVEEYLRLQGRFNHLTEDQIRGIQETVDREWERLLKKALD
ncbi:MAG: 3-methyl-2-oxobutanoate dehydrogenase subunit beta [Deltaproteobacteria bacterium]|nr:MAG: 3-methyl-2-oxobutanoate dehydrogenase subunit beta [Deltaproteobacteria bacterium]